MIIIVSILTSCPIESNDLVNAITSKDRTPPTLTDYTFTENKILIVTFDETVRITDATMEDNYVYRPSAEAKLLELRFSTELEAGIEKTLYFSAEDTAGNTSRYAIKLTGINLNQASLLITEVSMKGTESSPDRIELTAITHGSTLGYAIQDAVIGEEDFRYYLPDIYLYKNDIIVIYWDRCSSLPSTLVRDQEKTYYLFAESDTTLTSNNGAVVLYNHTNGKGKVQDAFLYNASDAKNNNGYGNSKSENSANYLISIEEWNGETFKSDLVTSSRVAARLYPYEDTNTESDFYITAARNSTFGYPNSNVIYEQ